MSKIKVSAGLVPSEDGEGESIPDPFLTFWWWSGNLWCFSTCRSITPISAFITWHSLLLWVQNVPLCKDTSQIGLGPTGITSS